MHEIFDGKSSMDLSDLLIQIFGPFVPSKFTVSMEGTDFDNLMNSNVFDVFGNMINFNGTTLNTFLYNTLDLI